MAAGRLLPLLALSGTLAAQDVPTVTLDDAVRLALRVQPAMVQARGDVDVAGAGRREATGNWLPTLSASSGWSANSTSRFDPNTQRTITGAASTSWNGALSASLELFDGFRRSAQGRAAGATQASADAALRTQEFQIALQTRQAFFNVVAADELLRVSATRVRRAQEQLDVARSKLAAGSATRSDTLRSMVELANAQLQRINAETQRATSGAALARLIGWDGALAVVVDDDLYAMAPLDTAALRLELQQTAPAVIAALASREASAAQVAVTRAQYMPSVSASYSRSVAGQDLGSLTPSWSARLSLNWNLFNGFTRESNVARTQAARDAAEARLEDTRRQAAAQFTQHVASLRSAEARIAIAGTSRTAAEEDLRVQRERYRLGAATIVEVLASQVSLDQAEVDFVQARLDFLVAKAQLEALLGRSL